MIDQSGRKQQSIQYISILPGVEINIRKSGLIDDLSIGAKAFASLD
jgi:hypothetical protein